MSKPKRLEEYHFHESDWSDHDELREEFEWYVPDEFNIADYICDRWADSKPDDAAMYAKTADGESVENSFEELRRLSNRLANYFRGAGVEAGDCIGVTGTQRIETLATHIAAFKLGAVSVPLSVLHGPEGIRFRLSDCDASAMVVDEGAVDALRSVADELPALQTIVTTGPFDEGPEVDFWDAVDGSPTTFDNVATDADDTACIIYTSGTTGEPKGVVHAHRHLLGILPTWVRSQGCDIDEEDVTRTIVEWAWIGSLNSIVLPSLFYGNAVVGSRREEFDPGAEFALVDEYGITTYAVPPTAIRMMMQHEDAADGYDLSSVETIRSGGEAVGDAIINWMTDVFPNASFAEGYGQTEAPALISEAPDIGIENREGYIGVAGLGHELAVLDPDTFEPIEEPGEVGELAAKYEGNPMLFKRYLGRPERTDAKIRDGWMLCEDLVSMDEDGYVKYHSRKDDVIISSGYRIGPTEIEECLETHEAVVNAGVIGVPHDTRGEIPKAFVELADAYNPDDDLREYLQGHVKENLAKYEYPREVEFVDELPRTSTSKIRRETLREWEGTGDN